nr:hypothetical protein [Arthrobacter sp. JCM 19049]
MTAPVDQQPATTQADAPRAGLLAALLGLPHWLVGLVVPALVLVAWQLATTSGLVPSYALPTPASVITAAVDLLERGELWTHIGISAQRVLLGFAAGSLLGLVFGAWWDYRSWPMPAEPEHRGAARGPVTGLGSAAGAVDEDG